MVTRGSLEGGGNAPARVPGPTHSSGEPATSLRPLVHFFAHPGKHLALEPTPARRQPRHPQQTLREKRRKCSLPHLPRSLPRRTPYVSPAHLCTFPLLCEGLRPQMVGPLLTASHPLRAIWRGATSSWPSHGSASYSHCMCLEYSSSTRSATRMAY